MPVDQTDPRPQLEAPLAPALRQGLEHGELHRFADWPILVVPRAGAIVYTIWDQEGHLVYAGMAGRGGLRSPNSTGPFGRLASHASGRRSGDQFNIYVCDRLVLPALHDRLPEIAAGTLSLDRETRDYIRGNLCFWFIEVPDGSTAGLIERDARRGWLAADKPMLNPL